MKEHVSLAGLSTLKVGGEARFLFIAKTEEEIKRAAAFAAARHLPIFILGGGSNILVSDEGFPGVVIKIETTGISYEKKSNKHFARVASGVSWDAFVNDTITHGFWGLENLSGIPGTVGAAPIQNIGAYGSEAQDVIESVRVFDLKTDQEKIFSNQECQFEYRDSIFKKPEGKDFVVLEVTFQLSRDPKPNIVYKDLGAFFAEQKNPPTTLEIRNAVLSIRSKKFPDLSKVGTAGSFFKNPIISVEHFEKLKLKFPELPSFPTQKGIKIPLAFVLDKICGLKGFKKGAVELFHNQPLVLVNTGNAEAKDIRDFAAEIAQIIRNKTGIEIENEVVFIE